MEGESLWLLLFAVFVVAVLYSSVGHAGASAYIAVMALMDLAPAVIKPTALALNIAVASIAAAQFWRAGYFRWQLFWPFALLSAPFAFVGGFVSLPTYLFRQLVGLALLVSALRLWLSPKDSAPGVAPSKPAALAIGAGVGLVAGLTGTGGGILLTPILVLKRWANAREAGAVSALFILLNSIAGLTGNLSAVRSFPSLGWQLLPIAVVGGALGSHVGSRRFSHATIKRMLSVVLVVAAVKLITIS